jgi:hypothetical protein
MADVEGKLFENLTFFDELKYVSEDVTSKTPPPLELEHYFLNGDESILAVSGK